MVHRSASRTLTLSMAASNSSVARLTCMLAHLPSMCLSLGTRQTEEHSSCPALRHRLSAYLGLCSPEKYSCCSISGATCPIWLITAIGIICLGAAMILRNTTKCGGDGNSTTAPATVSAANHTDPGNRNKRSLACGTPCEIFEEHNWRSGREFLRSAHRDDQRREFLNKWLKDPSFATAVAAAKTARTAGKK